MYKIPHIVYWFTVALDLVELHASFHKSDLKIGRNMDEMKNIPAW